MSTVGEEREAGVPRDTWRHVCAKLGEDMWEHEHVVLYRGNLHQENIVAVHSGPWQRVKCCLLISLCSELSYEELVDNVLIYGKVND